MFGTPVHTRVFGFLVVSYGTTNAQLSKKGPIYFLSPNANGSYTIAISHDTSGTASTSFVDGVVATSAVDLLCAISDITISPDDAILVATTTTSTIGAFVWRRSGKTFTRIVAPFDVPPGKLCQTGSFSPDGQHLVLCGNATARVMVYSHDGDGGFTKLADLSGLTQSTPVGTMPTAAKYSPDSTYLVVTNVTALSLYQRSGNSYTRLPDIVGASGKNVQAIAFASSNSGTYMAVAHLDTSVMSIYKVSAASFTQLAASSIPPNFTGGINVAFAPNADYLALTGTSGDFAAVYKRTGDTFALLPTLPSSPSNTMWGCAFSPDGAYLVLSGVSTAGAGEYIFAYSRSGDTFTKIASPITNNSEISTIPRRLAFSNKGWPK